MNKYIGQSSVKSLDSRLWSTAIETILYGIAEKPNISISTRIQVVTISSSKFTSHKNELLMNNINYKSIFWCQQCF